VVLLTLILVKLDSIFSCEVRQEQGAREHFPSKIIREQRSTVLFFRRSCLLLSPLFSLPRSKGKKNRRAKPSTSIGSSADAAEGGQAMRDRARWESLLSDCHIRRSNSEGATKTEIAPPSSGKGIFACARSFSCLFAPGALSLLETSPRRNTMVFPFWNTRAQTHASFERDLAGWPIGKKVTKARPKSGMERRGGRQTDRLLFGGPIHQERDSASSDKRCTHTHTRRHAPVAIPR